MTNYDLDLLIVAAIGIGAHTLSDVVAYVSACGGPYHAPRISRRLQALKRAQQIEFVRTPPLGWQIRS